MESNNRLAVAELEVLLGKYIETYTKTESIETIKAKVAAHIHDLLGSGIPNLMNFMYLVDVKEDLFNYILRRIPENEWPNALAQLVIDRLLEKVYTRLQYRK